MNTFSQKLTDECIKIFKEENNLEFSDDEADNILKNLSSFFIVFTKDNLLNYVSNSEVQTSEITQEYR